MAKNSRAAASAALTWARPAEPPPADRAAHARATSCPRRCGSSMNTDSRRSRCVAWARSSVPARPRSIGVRNKDELVDLMLDVIIGEVHADYEGAIAPDAPWREQLAEVARALRRVLLRHRHRAAARRPPHIRAERARRRRARDGHPARRRLRCTRSVARVGRAHQLRLRLRALRGALARRLRRRTRDRRAGPVGHGLLQVALAHSIPEHARGGGGAHLRGRSSSSTASPGSSTGSRPTSPPPASRRLKPTRPATSCSPDERCAPGRGRRCEPGRAVPRGRGAHRAGDAHPRRPHRRPGHQPEDRPRPGRGAHPRRRRRRRCPGRRVGHRRGHPIRDRGWRSPG